MCVALNVLQWKMTNFLNVNVGSCCWPFFFVMVSEKWVISE